MSAPRVVTQDELGRRLGQIRKLRGLAQVDLGDAVGLSQSAISRIETGDRAVDSIELADLAAALDVSVLDLLEEERSPTEHLLAARTTTPASGLDVAIRRARLYADISRLLDEVWPLDVEPLKDRVPFTYQDEGGGWQEGRDLAQVVRTEVFGLASDEPAPGSLPDAAEDRLALHVAFEPLTGSIDGICLHETGFALALVNSAALGGRQRFTLAHELCHHLCQDPEPVHVDEDMFTGTAVEERANAFAANFLLPQEGIRRVVGDRPVQDESVVELQYEFGVSLDALLWQLKNNRLITEKQRIRWKAIGAGQLARQTGKWQSWTAMQRARNQRRPPRYLVDRALEAFVKGAIGVAPLAELLGQDPDEVHEQLHAEGILPAER